jgi:CDP-glucose 4,6-dehydratase
VKTIFGDIYRNRRVLITGHTGFKGSWLVSWLSQLGAEIYGYSDGVPTIPSLFEAAGLAKHVRSIVGDIRDSEHLSRIVNEFRPHFVFHLAAQAIVGTSYAEPHRTFGVNVMGTVNVLDALRQLQDECAAVIVTSDKAYNNVEWCWGYRETDALGGKDIYSGSKGAAEFAFYSFFHSFFQKKGCPVHLATARAGNVIGGGDWARDRIVADCMRAWRAGNPVYIRSPRATRPWQHVLEPLSGYLALGAALAKEGTVNFGPKPEQTATVAELISRLTAVWGYEQPSEAYKIVNEVPFHEATLLKLNIDKAMLLLQWQPTLSATECIAFTGKWYKDVIKDGAGADRITKDQINEYMSLAKERQQGWVT